MRGSDARHSSCTVSVSCMRTHNRGHLYYSKRRTSVLLTVVQVNTRTTVETVHSTLPTVQSATYVKQALAACLVQGRSAVPLNIDIINVQHSHSVLQMYSVHRYVSMRTNRKNISWARRIWGCYTPSRTHIRCNEGENRRTSSSRVFQNGWGSTSYAVDYKKVHHYYSPTPAHLQVARQLRETLEVLARQYRLRQQGVEIECPVVAVYRQHISRFLELPLLFLGELVNL